MAILSLKGATVTIGTVTLKIGTGNVTYSEKQTVDYTPNAGRISEDDGGIATLGDPQPVDVSLEATFDYGWITDGYTVGGPLHDVLVADDELADCPIASTTIEVTFPEGGCGPGLSGVTFNNYRWESIKFDVSNGKVSTSGKCIDSEALDAVAYTS